MSERHATVEDSATRVRASLSVIVLTVTIGGASCAGPPAVPPPPAPPREAPIRRPRAELEAAHKAAYERATQSALRRDFAGAIKELEPFARETESRDDLPLAYWIHNQLTWLRWGLGDLTGALRETELGKAALDRSKLNVEEIASMRLHELWDRAYLLLDLKDTRADQALIAYETLAKERNDRDGLAVLQAFFAARKRKNDEALRAAKNVDVEQDTDLQDLYVIALALDLGDPRSAASVRLRICKGSDYLMKPLIVAQMEREGFKCP